MAGWGFVVGKTASCAAMAPTFATTRCPARDGPSDCGLAAVIVLTLVNLRGITRTARLTRVIVAVTVTVLLGRGRIVLALGHADADHLTPAATAVGYGVLQSAGLLFFAFAGYARIATLGEEVIEPERTIPRAVVIALIGAFALYALVAVGSGHGRSRRMAATATPLTHATATVGAAWASPVVRIGAAVASLGSLLALLAGVGRTGLAMAREGDLPARWPQ